jgi:hypothetical protein
MEEIKTVEFSTATGHFIGGLNFLICVFTVFMAMPETAMNKNDRFVFWEDNIRFARKVFPVQSETETHFMKM